VFSARAGPLLLSLGTARTLSMPALNDLASLPLKRREGVASAIGLSCPVLLVTLENL
jgi:hypothetical protein